MLEHLNAQIEASCLKILSNKQHISQFQANSVEGLLKSCFQNHFIEQPEKHKLFMVISTNQNQTINASDFITNIQKLQSQLNSSKKKNLLQNGELIQNLKLQSSQFYEKPNYVSTSKANKRLKSERSFDVEATPRISKDIESSKQINPQHFKIDLEVSHKLYQLYKKFSIGSLQNGPILSFEDQERSKETLNYHKILQIFKDLNLKLEISQKLQILRSIKKYSFNQQFISPIQFNKILKVIIYSLGFKETQFRKLIKEKNHQFIETIKHLKVYRSRPGEPLRLNRNLNRKIKTEMPSSEINFNNKFTEGNNKLTEGNKTISIVDHRFEYASKINPKKVEIDKDLKQERQRGYLNQAMQKNKIKKLTWESLYSMSEENMHFSISIPNILPVELIRTDFY